MRTKFPGYFKKSEDELKTLWTNSLIVLDANILLNLYRYSEKTRKEFIDLFDRFKARLWVPYQAAKEFLDNRLGVINEQQKTYTAAKKDLLRIEEELKQSSKHPFINDTLLTKFVDLNLDICKDLDERSELYSGKVTDDDILNELGYLLESKVGEDFNSDEIKDIYKEAEERYSQGIPPGYKDVGKSGNKQYGDVILWKQILHKSKDSDTDIIFITDDKKEDWWLISSGKTIGARPELIKEFVEFTSRSIHIYRPDGFYKYAKESLEEVINPEIADEIKSLESYNEIPYYNYLQNFAREQNINIHDNNKQFYEKLVDYNKLMKSNYDAYISNQNLDYKEKNNSSSNNSVYENIHNDLIDIVKRFEVMNSKKKKRDEEDDFSEVIL